MATIHFNPSLFRAQFPIFNSEITYPNASLQMYWDMASAYVSDRFGGCYIYGLNLKQRTLALNLMTAHLAALYSQINNGEGTGILTGSTIDKVTVQLLPPPATNQWQFWLNQTPYGTQLLALLKVASAGGMYFGGVPVLPAFRH